ncbi:MAG: DegV family protein [Lachnospiraceae bacterium]
MWKRWMRKFYDSGETREVRMFQVIAIGGIAAAVLAAVTSAATGLSLTVVIGILLGGLVLYALMHVVRHTKKTQLCSCILIAGLNVFLIPIAYFAGGGIRSGIGAWFVLGIFVVFLLLKGVVFWLMLAVSFASMIATYVVSYLYPELVVPFESELMSYQDMVFSILIVSLIVGLVIRFQNYIYEEEQKKVLVKNEELERVYETKNKFFANMSHEIRTPINTIIGLNEMILREDVSDEIAENAIHIQEASKMLLALINDILDMSKIESGKMEIVPVQYETGAMFSELVNIIWIRAHEKKLEFKIDISPEIPSMLFGDEVRIKQIVTNLLTNAVKYTQKGYVTLTARGEQIGNNRLLLTISVKDSGAGIKKEDMQYLFQSFKRVDEGKNSHIEGTGLGLSISSQLVGMMGGKITVDSIYQKGSVFTVQIEQDIVDANPMGRMDFMNRGSGQKRKRYQQSFEAPDAKVLIVDDNEMNLLVAKKLLRGTKIQADLAKSGKECLECTKHKFYNVIFMDHMMPEMDGVETLSKLRRQENGLCREVPVIALTANVVPGADKIYRDMGFQGYLAKPISGSLLEAMLLKHLPKELVEYNALSSEDEEENSGLIQLVSSKRKKKVYITTDCVCDLPEEAFKQYEIGDMYYYVNVGKARFCDVNEITSGNLLEYLATHEEHAKSHCASVEEYETFFANALSIGEQVIHISMAQHASDGYKTAMAAAQGFDNVTVVDSGHLSSGMGLMVIHAADMAKKGYQTGEILNELEKIKSRISTSFIVPSADCMYRSGKVGKPVKDICDLLNLHPVLALKRSRITLSGIKSGNLKRSYNDYIRKALKGKKNIDTRVLFITYAGCTVRQQKEFIEEVNKYQKFDKIILQKASATISSNCGLGAMGVLFMKRG